MAETTTQTTPAPTYPLLWYTSNTVISTGQRTCAMARYLGYHAGPHGTGYRRKSNAIPLATGSAVHSGVERLTGWIAEWQQAHGIAMLPEQLPKEVIGWAATEAADAYAATATKKGLLLSLGDATADAEVARMIAEQRTLVEGLIWVYALTRLPVMLRDYVLVSSEAEEAPVVACTCGLGDWVGQDTDHAARGCTGIVAMGKTDLLWDAKDGSGIVYEELKTKASPRGSWNAAWEHSGQLWLNMEAASKRLGREVTAAYVTVLYKGWRGKDRNAGPADPKWQHSPICSAYFDPGAPPISEPNWAINYYYTDELGKNRAIGKSYSRVSTWEEPAARPIDSAFPGASRIASWVINYVLPQASDLVEVLGPFPRQRARSEKALAGVIAEEVRWRGDVEAIRSGEYDAETIIPRSWNCTGYDGTPCAFKGYCLGEPGWEELSAVDRLEIRTPHHAPEKVAMTEVVEGLGLRWTDAEDDDAGDGEDG